jgi:hypothetical protein
MSAIARFTIKAFAEVFKVQLIKVTTITNVLPSIPVRIINATMNTIHIDSPLLQGFVLICRVSFEMFPNNCMVNLLADFL